MKILFGNNWRSTMCIYIFACVTVHLFTEQNHQNGDVFSHVSLTHLNATQTNQSQPKGRFRMRLRILVSSSSISWLLTKALYKPVSLQWAGHVIVFFEKGNYLEDHPRYCKWLGSPPFTSHEKAIWKGNKPFTNHGYQPLPNWDDAPSIQNPGVVLPTSLALQISSIQLTQMNLFLVDWGVCVPLLLSRSPYHLEEQQ